MNRTLLKSLIVVAFACATGAMAAFAASPGAGYKIDPDSTITAPDGVTRIEQYAKPASDGSSTWQFWARRNGQLSQLKSEPSDYRAGFRFTTNSQWLVRMQKIGAGYADLYLYRLTPQGFVAATKKSLSDLAWAYFNSHPDAKKVAKPNLHISADLVAGTHDDYRSLGMNWPASRYIVVTLSGDVDSTPTHAQLFAVRGWRCRYDLTTERFDVPADFAEHNAEALAP